MKCKTTIAWFSRYHLSFGLGWFNWAALMEKLWCQYLLIFPLEIDITPRKPLFQAPSGKFLGPIRAQGCQHSVCLCFLSLLSVSFHPINCGYFKQLFCSPQRNIFLSFITLRKRDSRKTIKSGEGIWESDCCLNILSGSSSVFALSFISASRYV